MYRCGRALGLQDAFGGPLKFRDTLNNLYKPKEKFQGGSYGGLEDLNFVESFQNQAATFR